jgi:hypothetical protein
MQPNQDRISWGIHGPSEVSLGPAIPNLSMPCGWPSLKRPYGCFRGDHPKDERPAAILLPLWIPHAIQAWTEPTKNISAHCRLSFLYFQTIQGHSLQLWDYIGSLLKKQQYKSKNEYRNILLISCSFVDFIKEIQNRTHWPLGTCLFIYINL